MVLKYGDGRKDVPISHWHYENADRSHRDPRPARHEYSTRPRPHTAHYSHDRSRSAADAYPPAHSRYHEHIGSHYQSSHYGQQVVNVENDFAETPEEIQILPADPNAQPHRSTGTYRPRRSSEPFRARQQSSPHADVPEVVEAQAPAPRYIPNNVDVPPPVVYSHSQPIHDPYDHRHPAHSHSRGNRPPPSIVYAPGHHSGDHYAPPTIVYAPHKAPGMTHTISAPTGSGFPQYPRITATPYPSARSPLDSVHEEPRYGPRGPRPREDIPPRGPSPISETTGDSGSTYYVIPTPGQKIKVLVGPEESLYTATSTTKSGSSPHSPHSGSSGGPKKPLFSRLMSFASDLSRSSKGSKSSKKKLQRRHSIDASAHAHPRER
ncbi:hypothetical protein F5I97DRAFT_1800663 [Phlebopus sp. FC_14]|nr:hypothetical protein F5I97DRAFT_1800663 [Phlebopus sp. FC_14]